jgi:MHS family proline/betaine transporter-like MFS transporter
MSAICGNILEYYDFTVYSVFSVIIGKTFCPSESQFIQIISSLMFFAVGFLTRPIGGIFFGYIGDHYGRRISLIISMLGMTIPTFIIGLIPSYEYIGIVAPILLVIMRLIQGLCISGEGAGAAIFILEHHQHLKPGLTTGLVHGSNIAGTLIATCLGLLIEKYFSHIEFAWRFAFLLGGFFGLIGLYLRLHVAETPIFQMLSEQKRIVKSPFVEVVKTAFPSMFLTFAVGAVASSVLYLVKTYVNVFYYDIMHFDNSAALTYLLYTSFIAMISMPIFGAISDIIGKLPILLLSTIAIFVLSFPTMLLMSSKFVSYQILSLTLLGGLGGAISAAAYIFIISIFKPEQKFSGVGFSYNLGIAIFGGTSPVISRLLIESTGLYYAPAFYIMTTSGTLLLIILLMKEKIKQLLKDNMSI